VIFIPIHEPQLAHFLQQGSDCHVDLTSDPKFLTEAIEGRATLEFTLAVQFVTTTEEFHDSIVTWIMTLQTPDSLVFRLYPFMRVLFLMGLVA
jgi:hypothetical protein